MVIKRTRMWTNAQRDGRPAEHRWRPLFNAAKFSCRSLLYIAASTADLKANIDTLERCTAAVHQWLLHNGLQLNPSKSEAIQFTAGRGREQVDDVSSLQVSDAAIQPSPTIKTLGVTLDRLLTFDQHVANVCKAGYFHIRVAPRAPVSSRWRC